jgi:hypothetical protein
VLGLLGQQAQGQNRAHCGQDRRRGQGWVHQPAEPAHEVPLQGHQDRYQECGQCNDGDAHGRDPAALGLVPAVQCGRLPLGQPLRGRQQPRLEQIRGMPVLRQRGRTRPPGRMAAELVKENGLCGQRLVPAETIEYLVDALLDRW